MVSLSHGEFIEVHQPLGGVDEYGHAIPLEYQGAPVPKRTNQPGIGGSPVPGSLLTPGPVEDTAAVEEARHDEAEAARNGHNFPEVTTRTEQREAITEPQLATTKGSHDDPGRQTDDRLLPGCPFRLR